MKTALCGAMQSLRERAGMLREVTFSCYNDYFRFHYQIVDKKYGNHLLLNIDKSRTFALHLKHDTPRRIMRDVVLRIGENLVWDGDVGARRNEDACRRGGDLRYGGEKSVRYKRLPCYD